MVGFDGFVGRRRELAAFRASLDRLTRGTGGCLLVVGEPGVGKTRLVQEFDRVARQGRTVTVWGRAHEVAGNPPYWPWAQVMGALNDAEERGETSGPSAGTSTGVEVIGPLLADAMRVLDRDARRRSKAGPALADPESARFSFFVSVERLLRAMSEVVPLVVVLDDLQWADAATLALLEFVVPNLADAPVLFIGTHRDTASSALSPTIASLARHAEFHTFRLEGLSEVEVAEYLGETADSIDPAVLRARTGGNPFFVREIVSATERTGFAGRPASIPQSIIAAIDQRLTVLSADCRRLLTRSAILGSSIEPAVLSRMMGTAASVTLDLLDEGERAGFLVSAPNGRVGFAHDLVRETLTHHLAPSRIATLHGEVGAALAAELGDLADDRASDLAEHFVSAARLDASFSGKAARYSELAGQAAEAVWAWEEAAQHYQHALELAPGLPEGGAAREARLLLALGRAQRDGQRWSEAERTLLRAVERYRQIEDWRGFGEAVVAFRNVGSGAPRDLAREAVAVDDSRDPALRAELLMRVARLWDDAEARAAAEESERLALECGAAGVLHELAFRRALFTTTQRGFDAATSLFDAAHRWAVAAGDLRREYSVVMTRTAFLVALGRLAETTAPLAELQEMVRQRRDASGYAATFAFHFSAVLHFLRGGLALPEPDPDRPGARPSDWFVAMHQAVRLEHRGDLAGAVLALERGGDPFLPAFAAAAPGLLARLKWRAAGAVAARADFERWSEGLRRPRPAFLPRSEPYAMLDDALLELADEPAIIAAYDTLASDAHYRLTRFLPGSGLDQLRGAVALHLGRLDDAERWYRIGAEWAADEGCPIELGRNLAGAGEVVERRGRRAEAVQLLERAIGLFETYGARYWRDRWQARLNDLRSSPPSHVPGYPDGLTAREVEVLRLVAQGLTNADIATALGIASGTVARHITNLLGKSGTANRTEAASYAARHRLLEFDDGRPLGDERDRLHRAPRSKRP